MDGPRALAERQVEAFIEILRVRYGLEESDIPKILDTIKWAGEHRARMDRAIGYSLITMVGLVVAGAAAAMWEGMRHFLVGK